VLHAGEEKINIIYILTLEITSLEREIKKKAQNYKAL
jgi:hypothetical protein